MRFLNCNLDEAYDLLNKYKIVFFGQGAWLQNVEFTPLMSLENNFSYIIDNNPKGNVSLGKNQLKVKYPEAIKGENKAAIILTSPIYMYDMYQQLEKMHLSDAILCLSFPFMQLISNKKYDPIPKTVKKGDEKIPKIIHSFWFSGDEKPDSYKKCVDTWPIHLEGYEIKEWNKDNYDWHKNAFLKKAIECEAWAFATDYARLDVLYQEGGIYLDMDVEVLKSFDDLLDNKAILAFSNNIMVDLAVLGSQKHNRLIKKLLDLYDNVDLPSDKSGFSRYFQPSLIRKTIADSGICMDGSFQICEDATVYPKEYFMPQDHVIFRFNNITENTHCIHYDNFGWSNSTENKRFKKIRDNNLLWDILQNQNIIES